MICTTHNSARSRLKTHSFLENLSELARQHNVAFTKDTVTSPLIASCWRTSSRISYLLSSHNCHGRPLRCVADTYRSWQLLWYNVFRAIWKDEPQERKFMVIRRVILASVQLDMATILVHVGTCPTLPRVSHRKPVSNRFEFLSIWKIGMGQVTGTLLSAPDSSLNPSHY